MLHTHSKKNITLKQGYTDNMIASSIEIELLLLIWADIAIAIAIPIAITITITIATTITTTLVTFHESRQEINWKGKDDGRVFLSRYGIERLEVA